MISNVSDIWHQHIKAISANVSDMADKMNDFPTLVAKHKFIITYGAFTGVLLLRLN